jgi:defect-in-organelle-trafficking protein DotC
MLISTCLIISNAQAESCCEDTAKEEIKSECAFLLPLPDKYHNPTLSEVKTYPKPLQQLIAMGNPDCDYFEQKQDEKARELRTRAVKEAAFTVAIQTAVKWRYDQITTILQSIEYDLNTAFDFRPLLLYGERLLPPVITKAGSSFQLSSPVEAVSADTTYRIFQDAKIVTAPPSWRDYMWKEFKVIDEINPAVIPKDEEEEIVWKKAVIKGWHEGMQQAHRLFRINLNRLVRDYNGIITYTLLEHQGIVSMPMLSKGEFSVQLSDDGRALDIERKIFRLTTNVKFTDIQEWKPSISTVK